MEHDFGDKKYRNVSNELLWNKSNGPWKNKQCKIVILEAKKCVY